MKSETIPTKRRSVVLEIHFLSRIKLRRGYVEIKVADSAFGQRKRMTFSNETEVRWLWRKSPNLPTTGNPHLTSGPLKENRSWLTSLNY